MATERQLTPHFKLSEFAVSASHPDMVVPVPASMEGSIARVATQLELVRVKLGRPMTIISGYRSKALNQAIDGSSKTSQHMQGEAADFTCHDIRAAFETIIGMVERGELDDAGQIIYYPNRGFIHFAIPSKRFPKATVCVHWPEHGMKYRPFTPTLVAFAQLVPSGEFVA